MELILLWRLFLQNRFIVILVASSIACLSFFYTSSITPLYQAGAKLFVSTPASNLDITQLATGSSFSQQRVKSYSQIINSPLTLAPVIKELKLKISAEELSSQIYAAAPLDTVLITLVVTDPNPYLAAKIANAVANQFGLTVSKLELSSASTDSPVKVSVVQMAKPNPNPISPNKKINYGIGILLGFTIGMGIAYLRRVSNNTVKGEADLEGIPLLAAIGFDADAEEKPLVTQIGKYAVRTEAFRTLRTNIQFLMPDKHPQVIIVTSAFPGEGKTTSSINLALSLTLTGSSVILVEADLRRPKVATYLEVSAMALGLSEAIAISGQMNLSTIKRSTRRYEGSTLDVITAGAIPPNPAELLSSKKFDSLINLLRKKYEYVVIDCPPILPVTDAAIISTRSDGALIVVHAGVTRRPHFRGTRDALKAVGTEILGVVINKIPASTPGEEYGYGYGYSKYYGGYYRPSKKLKEDSQSYAPSKEVLDRQSFEEDFNELKGRRFKEELSRKKNKN